jgi:hypothetical protein
MRKFPNNSINILQPLCHSKLTMLPVRRIAPMVKELVTAGAIRQLETYREGGPFYAPAGYVEASEKRDHSDQRLYRNYGGQIYDSQAWTDDV